MRLYPPLTIFVIVGGQLGWVAVFEAKRMNFNVIFSDPKLFISCESSGVPLAAVGINNAKNASFLAARILGIKHDEISWGDLIN